MPPIIVARKGVRIHLSAEFDSGLLKKCRDALRGLCRLSFASDVEIFDCFP